ncbi:MAG: FAD-dependent thymidylate synthase [Candidatus Woesearchaeota archaeon]
MVTINNSLENKTIDKAIANVNNEIINNSFEAELLTNTQNPLEIELITHTQDPILVTATSMMVSRTKKKIKDLLIPIIEPSVDALLAAEKIIVNNSLKRGHSSTLDLTFWLFSFYRASRVFLDAIANKRFNSLDVLSERYTSPIRGNTTIKLLQNYSDLYDRAIHLRKKEWDFYDSALNVLIDFWTQKIMREDNEKEWEYKRRLAARALEDVRYGTDQGTQTQFTLAFNTRQLRKVISDFKASQNPELKFAAYVMEKLSKSAEAKGLENYKGIDELLKTNPTFINNIKEKGVLLRFTDKNTYIEKRLESSEKTLDKLISKYKPNESSSQESSLQKIKFQTWLHDDNCVVLLDKPSIEQIKNTRNILVREIIRETKALEKNGKYHHFFNNEEELTFFVNKLSEEEKDNIIESYLDGMRVFDQPGRAFESIQFRFTRVMSKTARSQDIRHRIVDAPIEVITTPDYGFMIPPIFQIVQKTKNYSYNVEDEYKRLAEENAKLLIDMQKEGILPYIIQYHQLKGMRTVSTVTMNGRQLFHYFRLRRNKDSLKNEFEDEKKYNDWVIYYLQNSHAQWDIAHIAELMFREIEKLDIFPRRALELMKPRTETFNLHY